MYKMIKVLSSIMAFALIAMMQNDAQADLINVNFNAHLNPGLNATKVGFAATGDTTNDFWNVYSRDVTSMYDWRSGGIISPLYKADSSVTSALLSVTNAPGAWSNGTSDNMYYSYLYPFDNGNITLSVYNLPAGDYDFYVYAHGAVDGENSSVNLVSGSTSYGTASTTSTSAWNSVSWSAGDQYVYFGSVSVASSSTVRITISPGVNGLAVINGLQIRLLDN